MNIRKQFEEQMTQFFSLHTDIRSMVSVVFTPAERAGLDDLYDAKKLVENTKKVKEHLDQMLAARNLRLNIKKNLTTF